MTDIKLGLFGSGIGKSQAPKLHELAGKLCGINVSYDLFDLNQLGINEFENNLWQKADSGFTGVNVTHPVKEIASKLISIPNPVIQRIGAINTIRFADKTGYNTDYTGFINAFKHQFGTACPGKVLIIGAGGAGKAVAFALGAIDPNVNIRLVDTDLQKAQTLANDLSNANIDCAAYPTSELNDLSAVDGLINCTPSGMYQYPGSAFPKSLVGGQRWAFDAVYTPLETQFLQDAKAKGLELLSGYELFFYQGLAAFEIFTGAQVDEVVLRKELAGVVQR